jgi:hypothetical protein
LEINGKLDILNFIGELADIEPKISNLQKFSRDHVVHAINSFLTGVYILEKVNFLISSESRFQYPFMWKFCGPTHDLGYPLEISHNVSAQYFNKLNGILDKLNSPSSRIIFKPYPEDLNNLCKFIDSNQLIQHRITEWNLDINIYEYYEWLSSGHRLDHGVISALTEMKVIDSIYYDANPQGLNINIEKGGFNFNQINFNQDIVSACSAIFIHNIDLKYPGFKSRIQFNTAPLAFLLIFCDTFQEWDRYSRFRNILSGDDFDINCTPNSIEITIPSAIEDKIILTLNKRLIGLKIIVNGKLAVEG